MSYNIYDKIFRNGFVPVLEDLSPKTAAAVAEAMKVGGLDLVDISFAGKQAEAAVKEISARCPDVVVGVSGVKTADECAKALAAGAKFVISEGVDEACVSACAAQDALLIPRCGSVAEIRAARDAGVKLVDLCYGCFAHDIVAVKQVVTPFVDMKFIISLGEGQQYMDECAPAPFVHAVRGRWISPKGDLEPHQYAAITMAAEDTVTAVLGFEMYHIGINMEDADSACGVCDQLNTAFRFKLRDNGPSSRFAGIGIEVMKRIYRGKHGHFAVRTNNCDRAILYLKERGYEMDMDTAYIADGRIYTVYLKEEHSFGGFAAHLLQKAF